MAKYNGKRTPTLYDLFHKNPFSGKGVSKKADVPRTFKNFFKLSWWHISHIFTVNMAFILGNFPLIFLLLGFSGLLNDASPSPASSIYAALFGTMQEASDPFTAALYGIHGMQGSIAVTTLGTKIMYGIGALVVFTFGLTNIGTTYILRNLIKGEPIFAWHDFWYAIKRNLRQGFIMGIIDLIILVMTVYDVIFFYFNLGSFTTSLMFYASILLAIVYFIMRFYIYNLIITFDLSLFKIIKNAFIFSALGLKRNIAALIGIALLVIIDYTFLLTFLPLGVMLPFMILYGYCAYIGSYAAWPKIKEIMIDPYATEEEPEEDAIFEDDVL